MSAYLAALVVALVVIPVIVADVVRYRPRHGDTPRPPKRESVTQP